jgi:hypothetical protein
MAFDKILARLFPRILILTSGPAAGLARFYPDLCREMICISEDAFFQSSSAFSLAQTRLPLSEVVRSDDAAAIFEKQQKWCRLFRDSCKSREHLLVCEDVFFKGLATAETMRIACSRLSSRLRGRTVYLLPTPSSQRRTWSWTTYEIMETSLVKHLSRDDVEVRVLRAGPPTSHWRNWWARLFKPLAVSDVGDRILPEMEDYGNPVEPDEIGDGIETLIIGARIDARRLVERAAEEGLDLGSALVVVESSAPAGRGNRFHKAWPQGMRWISLDALPVATSLADIRSSTVAEAIEQASRVAAQAGFHPDTVEIVSGAGETSEKIAEGLAQNERARAKLAPLFAHGVESVWMSLVTPNSLAAFTEAKKRGSKIIAVEHGYPITLANVLPPSADEVLTLASVCNRAIRYFDPAGESFPKLTARKETEPEDLSTEDRNAILIALGGAGDIFPFLRDQQGYESRLSAVVEELRGRSEVLLRPHPLVLPDRVTRRLLQRYPFMDGRGNLSVVTKRTRAAILFECTSTLSLELISLGVPIILFAQGYWIDGVPAERIFWEENSDYIAYTLRDLVRIVDELAEPDRRRAALAHQRRTILGVADSIAPDAVSFCFADEA